MSRVGTWDWAEATGGRLRRRDRAHLLRQAVLARLAAVPARWRATVLPSDVSFVLPDPPDSTMARLAEERVRELSTPELHAHCLRTWLFAVLFAQRDRIAHDEELLYLACVLHDLGLTDAHDQRDPAAACFAVEGGRAAHALLCDHGFAADRACTVAEAISLHLNISVPAGLGVEAHLLSKGAALDAVGRGMRQLPQTVVRGAIGAWPRDGFTEQLNVAMRRQARARPESRAAFLWRLGFGGLVLENPLDR